VIDNAAEVTVAATQEDNTVKADGKNPAAKALGSLGGKVRASSLSKARRKEIARTAAKKRWAKPNGE
jgi:hypothetical protein